MSLSWKLLTADAPWLPRDSAGCHAFKGKLFIEGGWRDSLKPTLRDVWSSEDGRTWKPMTRTAPWVHADFATTNVALAGRMLRMGGWTAGRLPNASSTSAVWASHDGASWKHLVDAPWSSREGAAAVVLGPKVFLLGGATYYYYPPKANATQLLNDVWSSEDGVSWECVSSHAPWAPRAYHGAVSFQGRIFLMGGGNWQSDGGGATGRPTRGYFVLNDVWSSADGANWRLVAAAPWAPRMWFGAVVHRERIWMLGGWAMPTAFNTTVGGHPNFNMNDVWSSADGAVWERDADAAWNQRHAPCVVAAADGIWVLSGNNWNYTRDPHGTVNEVWVAQ